MSKKDPEEQFDQYGVIFTDALLDEIEESFASTNRYALFATNGMDKLSLKRTQSHDTTPV